MKFDIKAFFIRNWQHFAAIAFFIVVAVAFYQPQMDGMKLKQHDIEQWQGMAHEARAYRAETGEEVLWTNSMFGGMPAAQISVNYPGNVFLETRTWFSKSFPGARGHLLLHMLGFYIFALFLRIKPLLGVLGAVALAFSTYEILILQAGHTTKSVAFAFMAPALGAFIYSFRTHRVWGILWTIIFMGYEFSANHFQITYYLIFLLFAIGVSFMITAYKKKQLKPFFITSGGLIVAIAVAAVMNLGNILLTADYAPHTIRGANDVSVKANGEPAASTQSLGLDRDYITHWSYGLGESFNMLSPSVMGGGSFYIKNSQFEDVVTDSEFTEPQKRDLMSAQPYWGEQPVTGGPTYLGIVVVLLAFLGLVFIKSGIKWPLLVITLLAVFLSWGKNFMGLTDFFIDYIPGYDKFRTVTMILVLVQLCVVVLGVFFLSELVKNRDEFIVKKNKVAIALGGFFVFILIVKIVGIGNYSSLTEKEQLSEASKNLKKDVLAQDPQKMLAEINLNINNPAAVDEYVSQRLSPYYERQANLEVIREEIFQSSMNRSLIFIFITGGLILAFLFTSLPAIAMSLGVLVLVMVDLVPIANDYIGDEDKYWDDAELMTYPVTANDGDRMIMEAELAANPKLKGIIDEAAKKGTQEAEDLDFTGLAAIRNVVNANKFYALNMSTNYRVFESYGGFQSSRASYFHKSIGGYHGAKLRNFQNVIDFHLIPGHQEVYDMLNVKYFIQRSEDEKTRVVTNSAVTSRSAMGNAWFVKTIETHPTPEAELRALGNTFEMKNTSNGTLLINGKPKDASMIYGAEKVQYLFAGQDTIKISLDDLFRARLRIGEQAASVMDTNGVTSLVPMFTVENDTANSFNQLTSYTFLNSFNPTEEAVMLKSVADKLSKSEFSGKGKIEMKSYDPKKITYDVSVEDQQFAVFSEIYYPDGWTAYVDGKEVPIHKTNYLLRGIEIPKGAREVRFEFDQPKYHTSNNLSLVLSILLVISVFGYAFMFYRKKKSAKLETTATE
ncbi:MAG: hypothetical protein ACJASQ_000292 [Crocinitomicaceae bacterium]|jgi:hypothetical protein